MVGDLVPHPVPANTPGTSVMEAATLLLRIWAREFGALQWDGALPWIAMLRQAVLSSGGKLCEAPADQCGLLAAEFPSVSASVRAGRRLHALATGCAMESKGQFFGVAALIHLGAAADMVAFTRYFDQKARPAQTLLVAKRRAAPPESHRIEDVYSGELALYELSYAHREEAAAASEALIREFKDPPAVPPMVLPPSPARVLPAMAGGRLRVGSRSVAAVVAISMAIVAVMTMVRRPANHTGTATAPLARPHVEPPHQATPAPAVMTHSPEPPAKMDRVKKTPLPEPVAVADKPKRGRSDLTAEQLRQILARGQNSLDRGCYTEAMGLYRRVLENDPHNGPAIGGQEKARVRMQLSGENAQCSR